MKNAYIITNTEMVSILKDHLSNQGFNTSKLTVRFTSTNAVVAGITPVEKPAQAPSTIAIIVSAPEEAEEEDSFSLTDQVLAAITEAPKTIGDLADDLNVDTYSVCSALEQLGEQVEAVAPARVDGETVSAYMRTGTANYDLFVANERVRIDNRVEELTDRVLSNVPKFYQRRGNRPDLVNAICESMTDDAAEAVRRDARAVFYRMEEKGLLEHKGHGWRAAKSDSDKINVSSLQGAVREVLMQAEYGMSRQGIAEKLPGFVDDSLLRHAIKRMESVYEQGGMLHINS